MTNDNDEKEKSQGASKEDGTTNATQQQQVTATPQPSMTFALFAYWVIPVLLLALFGRSNVNTDIPEFKKPAPRPINIQLNQDYVDSSTPTTSPGKTEPRKKASILETPTPSAPEVAAFGPTAYQELVTTINSRRRRVHKQQPHSGSTIKKQQSTLSGNKQQDGTTTSPGAGPNTDPARTLFQEKIQEFRREYENDPTDIFKAIQFADTMRFYGLQYHDGGSYDMETIAMYKTIIDMAVAKRQALVDAGEPTDKSTSEVAGVSDEVTLDYPQKSADGLLCAIYSAQGKIYYMANMFEKAYDSYTACLDLEANYIDALNSRGSTSLVLGRYEDAAYDFLACIKRDRMRLFNDAFTGMERILEAQEDVVPGGWGTIVAMLDQLIPSLESKLTPDASPQQKKYLASALNRFHHVMFTYHDVKTKDRPEAWRHLTESFKHKMSILPAWKEGSEAAKINQAKQVFSKTFWPPGVGSDSRVPIFIIGFVRSGSTLLERVLDAHPLIVGTGENSVFNGGLEGIRDRIVKTSMSGQMGDMPALTREIGQEVVDEMRDRWEALEANTATDDSSDQDEDPQRFVDKMLTNYNNVGMIHMIYPNALILHVAREPMDTIFSAYKHEFPPGTLDYTSDFTGLSELYHSYREIMEHWDDVLPGRITHVRYEDMVHDMPGMARAIIDAAGLPWDETVLEFHKKKHAVNTLSSTQVRKGVYKDSLKAWKRFETELQPLVALIGEHVNFDLKTSLPSYTPLVREE